MALSQRMFTDEQEQEMARKYQAGSTYAQLMSEYGGCNATMRAALKRQGITPRSRGNSYRRFTPDEVADIARRWQAGESQTKIAEAYGSSQVTIGRVLRNNGITPVVRRPRGANHGSWKGGRVTHVSGYVFVRVMPEDDLASMRNATGYVAEHRLVIARSLGRPLTKGESVHHINGDKADNRIENLQLRHGVHGKGVAARCRACGSQDIDFDALDD